MKAHRDCSDRLSFILSSDSEAFHGFAERMISLYGAAVSELDGLDQRYRDFDVHGVIVVLHSDVMVGVSIQVENGTDEELLRAIAWKLKETAAQ